MSVLLNMLILASLRDAFFQQKTQPQVSHKTLHLGLISFQPSGLARRRRDRKLARGGAFFATPLVCNASGKCTPVGVRGGDHV